MRSNGVVLDNDENIRTFSKIKYYLDIKKIIKKKLQYLQKMLE